jgi:hypothetical protein
MRRQGGIDAASACPAHERGQRDIVLQVSNG